MEKNNKSYIDVLFYKKGTVVFFLYKPLTKYCSCSEGNND